MRFKNKSVVSEHFPANKVLWILVVQATAVVPHVPHLPSWILLVAMIVGVWRYHASRRQWRAPSVVLRTLLVAIGLGGIYLSYGTLLGRDAGVATIILMLALKLLELNRRRDVGLFILLGYFLVVTNFLYSQTVLMSVYMFLVTILLTSALAAVSDPGWHIKPAAHLRLATLLALQAVPIAILMFLLFPRVPGPLWRLPEDAHGGSTGLSASMSPGSISQLIRSSAVAFRVEFLDPAPAKSFMYWRGPVFDRYDGESWSAAPHAESVAPSANGSRSVRYQVTLEATGHPWLLALDAPATKPTNATISEAYELISASPIQARERYWMRSLVRRGKGIGGALSAAQRRQNLQLPPTSDPRTRALGQALAKAHDRPQAIVAAALERFRSENYVYTLRPPLLGEDRMDDFMFHTRKGFCEHYASAFVFLMRAAGIPARVVTGYQGGEYNPNGSYWIVRQSDAHAWAEIWLDSRGWVRIDPTAAVSPLRIEAGIDAALPENARWLSIDHGRIPWAHQVRLFWDSVNNGWNQWVLGYSPQRQLAFLRGLGLSRLAWLDIALIAAGAVSAALLLLVAAMAFRHRSPALDPSARAWRIFRRKLARVGIAQHAHEGPIAFTERAAELEPELAISILNIGTLYADVRYAESGGRARLRDLVHQIAVFNPRMRKPRHNNRAGVSAQSTRLNN